jgi:hypothetical protein
MEQPGIRHASFSLGLVHPCPIYRAAQTTYRDPYSSDMGFFRSIHFAPRVAPDASTTPTPTASTTSTAPTTPTETHVGIRITWCSRLCAWIRRLRHRTAPVSPINTPIRCSHTHTPTRVDVGRPNRHSNSLVYWTRELADARKDQSEEVARLRKDWWDGDVGTSGCTPSGAGYATLPPSFHVVGVNMDRIHNAEIRVMELGGNVY